MSETRLMYLLNTDPPTPLLPKRTPAPAQDLLLPVNELFGPTLQGEGPAAGQAAVFLRFAGCNLSCFWCDTPYTWDGSRFDLRAETQHRHVDELVRDVRSRPAGIVVLTGGEPLLQQDRPGWHELLAQLTGPRRIHIETNGTVELHPNTLDHAEVICVSPKLPNAGPHRGKQNPALHPSYRDLARWKPGLHLKVVVRDAEDVARAVEIADGADWPPERVWVMPEGATTDELAQRWPTIATAAAAFGVNASHRLHVLAWGERRGH